MDLSKVLELAEQANDFIEKMRDISNKYIKKINGYLEEIETLINNAATHSAQYINTKLEVIYKKIDGILEAFKEKINGLIEQLNTWYDEQMTKIKISLVKAMQAKLGLELPDSAAKGLADAIPHPALVIPEFKIEVPEISLDPNVSISIPRIPTL